MRFARISSWAAVAGAGVAFGLVGVEARADEPQDGAGGGSRSGAYLGLGLLFVGSNYDLDTTDLGVVPPEPAGIDPRFDDAFGVEARVGYRVSPRWAVELDYMWQEGFDSNAAAVNPPLEIDTHLLSLNAKFFALTGLWEPYAALGGSLLVVNTEIVSGGFKKPFEVDYGFAPRFALGIDRWLGAHWSVGLEAAYVLGTGAVDDADMFSIGAGIKYQF